MCVLRKKEGSIWLGNKPLEDALERDVQKAATVGTLAAFQKRKRIKKEECDSRKMGCVLAFLLLLAGAPV